MKVEKKNEFDDDSPQNPKIPEDYYEVRLDSVKNYERDENDAPGLIMFFEVLDDDVDIENGFDVSRDDGKILVPFFAPAKLSFSKSAQSSRLTENLMNVGLHNAVLRELDVAEAVMEDNSRVYPDSDESLNEFESTLKAFLSGKVLKVDVAYDDEGEESQVNRFSKLVEEDGSDDEDVILD